MAGVLFGLVLILAQKNLPNLISSEDEPKLKSILSLLSLLIFIVYSQLLSNCDSDQDCNDDTHYYFSFLPVSYYTIQKDRETERQKDRKTERQKDRKTERQKDKKTEGPKDRMTE
jgi:hypothetical protein